jgi:hypothetical protein
MAELPPERQVVLNARAKLDGWTTDARREAYEELFTGEDAILSPEDRRLLDAVDSELERGGGDGVWGTDEYGIHSSGSTGGEPSLGVICVYHAQITSDSVLRGYDDVDDAAEERINAALWQYSERVATLIEAELDAFV